MGANSQRPATLRAAPRRAVLIAGPTASGKSALAAALAEKSGGTIINADAMQVYAGMEVLTAAPGASERDKAPHRLFAHMDPGEAYSTGRWLADVSGILAEENPGPWIFVGGTGLYFEALTNGFAPAPTAPAAIVARVEDEVSHLDRSGRLALIAARDPMMASRLKGADPQRLIRALSVLEATGRSLAEYQDEAVNSPLDGFHISRFVLTCDRDVLATRIAQRFEVMLWDGAVTEVESLLARNLDPSLPAMKALGVPQIRAWLQGEIDREVMIERSIIATRQYAKRQRTWFRNRFSGWSTIAADEPIDPSSIVGDA